MERSLTGKKGKHMKQAVIIVLMVIAICSSYFWPNIKMRLAGNAQYTEFDKAKYDYYTPKVLKKMPRISQVYDFNYTNISGPKADVWSVTFYNTKDTWKISEYLSMAGYEKQEKCDIEAECWCLRGSDEVLTVVNMNSSNAVRVDILKSLYNDKYMPDK